MLKRLRLNGVGLLPNKELVFGERFNVFTGDNGLGKTFLMDVIWYALTRRWPWEVNPQLMCGYMAQPGAGVEDPSISFGLVPVGGRSVKSYTSVFKKRQQAWVGKAGRPYSSGLVIYAQVDGGFSVWDPARNYWFKRNGLDVQDREAAFAFSPREVWEGQYKFDERPGSGKTRCLLRGLLDDWLLWQTNPGSVEFPVLVELLRQISPPEYEIAIGRPTKVSLDDVREMPTVRMPYGDIPVRWTSSAIHRVLSLAYILVWAFSEHVKAARFLQAAPTSQVTLLFDELDAHLHPKWQRKVMKALVASVEKMIQSFGRGDGARCDVQIMTTTHSPLVMAALEDDFDSMRDKWFDFDFGPDYRTVLVEDRPFERRGAADGWLKSRAFDLSSTRSPESERILREAAAVLGSYTDRPVRKQEVVEPTPSDVVNAYLRLCEVLSSTDAFLTRYRSVCAMYGWSLP